MDIQRLLIFVSVNVENSTADMARRAASAREHCFDCVLPVCVGLSSRVGWMSVWPLRYAGWGCWAFDAIQRGLL